MFLVRSRLCSSRLLGAVGTVDVISADDKALVGQREGALLTVEAVLMPGVALIIHHIGAMAEPCRDIHQSVGQETSNLILKHSLYVSVHSVFMVVYY